MRVFDALPLAFRFTHPFLVLVRDICLTVVDSIAYVRFVFEHGLDLRQRPVVALLFRRARIDVRKRTMASVVNPTGGRHFLVKQCLTYFPCASSVNGEIENLLYDPLCFLVNDEGVFLFLVSLVAEGRVGKNSLTVCKLGVQRGLDLAAGIFRKPLIEDGLFGKGIGKNEKT